MRRVLKNINPVERQLTQLILMVGFLFIFVLAVAGYTYLRGELVMTDGKVEMDLTSLITGMNGKISYVWMGLLAVWLPLKAIQWGVKAYSWWVHKERWWLNMKKEALLVWNKLCGVVTQQSEPL